ncbi:hypothetical protein BH10ACT1_BH10ACT1_34800 [soil metagenome]
MPTETNKRTNPLPPTTVRPARPRPVRHGVALLAGLALLLSACLTGEQQSGLDALNKDRTANRVVTLGIQSDAQAKAQAWAEKLARENKLYHSTLSSGIRAKWCNIGENVGYASSVTAAEAAFMRSTTHRANIVNKVWNGVGIGVAKNGSRTFVVQVFIKTC